MILNLNSRFFSYCEMWGKLILLILSLFCNVGILICISQLLLCKKSGTTHQWHSTMRIYLAHVCAGWRIPAETVYTSAGSLEVSCSRLRWLSWLHSCCCIGLCLFLHLFLLSELFKIWSHSGCSRMEGSRNIQVFWGQVTKLTHHSSVSLY